MTVDAAENDIDAGTTDGAVLFDVDGVLVDSYPAYRRIWSRWASHRDLDPDLVWSHTHGRRPVDTIAVVAPHLDAETEYRLVREFMALEGDTFPVYPDAATVLSRLHGQRWSVVTSGQAPTVLQRLRAGGLPDPPVSRHGHRPHRIGVADQCVTQHRAELVAWRIKE